MMQSVWRWLAFAYMHLMMCGVFCLTLAIPTSWQTAFLFGPIIYVQICWAAHHFRSLQATADEDTRLSTARDDTDTDLGEK